MGIRESVEQSEEELNLHHLVLEEKPPKPELVFDPETEILDSDWQGMKARLDQFRQNQNWGYFSWQAMKMKLLDPEKAKPLLNLGDEAWQGMKARLDQFRQNQNWGDFSWQAMKMKLLDPERAKSLLKLDDEAWQGMKARLDQFRQNQNWWDFSWQAMKMKILAAKEVKITSQGIECIMPSRETFQEKKTPRPVRREF